MKIQIIGLGIVGTAHARLCQKLKHDVSGYDIVLNNHQYCDVKDHITGDSDITFICTPESAVEDVIYDLKNIEYKGMIVIRSTIPIGTAKYLSDKFGIHICHNPEFLRDKYYLEDIENPSVIVIGQCCQKHGEILESFYRPIDKPIVRVDTITSELVKLVINAHLSTLITFWNEIDELCDKLNLDTEEIAKTVRHDPRISNYGCKFFGESYGGKCLPKDIGHLIDGFQNHGLNPKLFEACEKFNEDLKKRKRKKEK